MPPSRYRVEERGRRLIVIDRASGREVSGRDPVPPAAPGEGGPLRREPPAEVLARRWRLGPPRRSATPDHFVTRGWFDDKAPRAIRLNRRNHAQFDLFRIGGAIVIAITVALSFLFWPLFLILMIGLLAPQNARSQLRSAFTRWLDQLDQAG
ncbi:hypothetical protein ACX40Y_03295 [Sphingomonas sp. RS6]